MSSSDIIKKTGLVPEDILSIIRELKGSRITSLSYRGLKIELVPEGPVSGEWTSVPPKAEPFDPTPPVAFSSSTTPSVVEAPEHDEDDLLEMIKLEDPEAYERLLEKKELEDAATEY